MSILPSNAGEFEIATADATDILAKLGASADLIARFKSVPGDPLLPILIWEYGLGEIQQYLVEPRRVIAEGIQWQRLRGTPAAMHMAFGWIGQTLTIEEEQGAHWATYQLGLPQIATEEEVRRVLHLAKLSQPARCRLWRIYTDVFDRRPIVVSEGPVLGDGWLSFYSGVPVNGSFEDDTEGVLVSFGVRNAMQVERYSCDDIEGSFGNTINLGFQAPYLDRFIVGRSALSHPYPRSHPFVMGSLFSILWADRATSGRSWRGLWDGRNWREYTGFDRKLPRWGMRQRGQSRSQLTPGWGEKLSDCNARLGVSFAAVIDNPGILGDFALSEHDHARRVLRLHEMFRETRRIRLEIVNPGNPVTAGAAHFAQALTQADPVRGQSGIRIELASRLQDHLLPQPQYAVCLDHPMSAAPVKPEERMPLGVRSHRAPQWSGAWTEPGRTWNTVTELNAQ
jgi:P2-related tail formation protein